MYFWIGLESWFLSIVVEQVFIYFYYTGFECDWILLLFVIAVHSIMIQRGVYMYTGNLSIWLWFHLVGPKSDVEFLQIETVNLVLIGFVCMWSV